MFIMTIENCTESFIPSNSDIRMPKPQHEGQFILYIARIRVFKHLFKQLYVTLAVYVEHVITLMSVIATKAGKENPVRLVSILYYI